ncbi:MAG: hypothetical protein HYY01_00990 [Chloroflexi bacterium]|nr:hypothetical protein [Chloroflexota bacterium]
MSELSSQRERPDNGYVVLLPVPQTVAYVRLKETLDEIEETSGDVALLFWILALLFFGLGDTVSSFLVFSKGGIELNPVMRWSLSLPGGLLAFVLVKTLALSLLYSIAHFWEGVHQWMIPLIMLVAGVYLTVSNLSHYFGL